MMNKNHTANKDTVLSLKQRVLSVSSKKILPRSYVPAFLERYPRYKGVKNIQKRLYDVYNGRVSDRGITECFESWAAELEEVRQ